MTKQHSTSPPTNLCLLGDAALIEQRLAALLDAWLPAAARTVDLHTFQCGETPWGEIIECARLAPMAGDCRVVLVRHLDAITADERPPLVAYLASPCPTGRLVLIGTDAPAATRQWLAAQLPVEMLTLESRQSRAEWAREIFASHGQSLTAAGSAALEQVLASEPGGRITDVLEHVSLYAGTERTIDAALIDELYQPLAPSTVFDLADAIGRGDLGTAYQLVAKHAADPYRLPELLGMLGWHFRRVWMGRRELDRGASVGVAARAANVPRSVEDRWAAQVRRWPAAALAAAADVLVRADTRIKRGGDPRCVLDVVVAMLATLPDGARGATSSATPYSRAEYP